MRILTVLLLFVLNSSMANSAAEVAQSFTIDGRLHTSSALNAPALLDSGVFRIQVLSPDAICMLYEETQNFNTTASDGYFSLAIGSAIGAVKRTASDSGNGMATVFSNTIISGISGKLASDGSTNCTYNPVASAVRLVRVKVTPVSDGLTRTLAPDLTLNSVPGAIVAERAESLQGLAPSSFLQLGTGSTNQSNIDNVFSATNYPRLTDLLSVGTGSYVRESANGAAVAPTVAGNAAGPAAGQFWYDTTANIMKYYDGSVVKSVGTVATASDLSSGTIGGAVAVNTSGNIATSGNITASGNGTTTGVVTGQTIATNQVNANLLRMADAQGSPKFIEFKAPASIGASNLTYTWPSAFPGSNMVLQSDNGGTLSWVAAGGGGTGDLKADGTIAMSADWDINGATAGGTRLLTGLANPSATDGASNKAYVDSAISTAAGSYVTKDGLTGLSGDWDANGATAGGTRKITGLDVPTVSDGVANKGYADANLRGNALATPVGQAGKSIRWNAGDTAWEYFTAGTGNGTVTNIATGTGLTGGPITTTGIISIAAGGVSATELAANAVETAKILNSNVTYTKIQDVSATNRLLGRATAGAGVMEEITLGTGLSFTGTTLNATGSGGTVTAVSSVNTDASVATGTSTPVITINTGTGNNQIVKLNGSAQIPAVDGSLVTSLNASNILSGTLSGSRLPTSVALAPSVPVVGNNGQSLRWNNGGSAWEYFTAGTGNGTVTAVSSANTDIGVASGSSTPVLTLNVGTGNNQILKLNGSAQIPAVDGSLLTSLNGTNITSGTVADARLSSNVALKSLDLSQFAATTSAQVAGLVSDETGTGAVVLGTSPTFTTSITSPMIIGGTGTTSTLTYKTTTGVGAVGADHSFRVGNNGGTEAMRILNSGNVGIGVANPLVALDVNGQIAGSFVTLAANANAMNLHTNHVSSVTISTNTTFTTTVPKAGTRASIIVITSGAVSRTITYGAGFKTVGNLATGTTAGRYFTISFVSDGTFMIETSRTVAM